MKKYISLLLTTFFRKKNDQINENNENEDYNVIYEEDGDKYNEEIINENGKEMNSINNSLNDNLISSSNENLKKVKTQNNPEFLHKNSANNIKPLKSYKTLRFEMKEIDQGKKLN